MTAVMAGPAGGPEVGARVARGGRRLVLIVILGSLTAFGPMSIDMYLPAFPALTAHFRTSGAQVQLTLTACLAGLALGQLLYGPLSDALGRRRPLFGGLALYTAASVLCAVAPTITALIGLRFLQGLGGAAGLVIARAVVSDLFQGIAAARFFSVLMLVNGLAPMLAPLLGAEVQRISSWPAVFVVLTGYGVALALGAAVGLPETLPRERRRSGRLGDSLRVFGQLAKDRIFLGYALGGGFVFAAMFSYISASSFVIQEVYHGSPRLFGMVFGINALGIVLASQLNGALVGRLSPRALLIAALGVQLAGGLGALAVAASGAGSLLWLLPPLFLTVASVGVIMPNSTALALDGHPSAAGTASALLGLLQYVFGAGFAPVVGLAGTRTALPMAIVIAVLGLAANLAVHGLARSPAEDCAAGGAA
jgi:DHA1 family bicyclomycin/chloramphenicol resistance-like MFS transporter